MTIYFIGWLWGLYKKVAFCLYNKVQKGPGPYYALKSLQRDGPIKKLTLKIKTWTLKNYVSQQFLGRFRAHLTLSWWMLLSYRNQSIDLLCNQWTGFYMIPASIMKGLPWNGVTLIGGVTLIDRVPLSNLLRYQSRSVFSLLVRLWKLTTDVRACVFICI